MTRIIIDAPTTPDEEAAFEAPRRPDGLWFAHMMIHDGRYIYADTFTELVGAIIDDYDGIPATREGDEEAWIQRYLYGASIIAVLQSEINAQAAGNGALAQCTPEQIEVLFKDKQQPFVGVDGYPHWDCPVPLIVIDAHYVPVNEEHPAPTGRVAVFAIDTEDQFIMSLDRFGLIGYGFREGDDVGEPYESEAMDDDDFFDGTPEARVEDLVIES
jgi:hypothetical protein